MTLTSAKQVRVETFRPAVNKRLCDARLVTGDYKPCIFHTAFAQNGLLSVSGLFTVLVKASERLGAPAVVVLLYR